MQQRAILIDYGSHASWRTRALGRLIDWLTGVLVTVLIAYALPLGLYALWAWLRLRPETWPEGDYAAVDPLGHAWQYWRPTPSVGAGGSSYWAAIEQGERWKLTAACCAGALALVMVLLLGQRLLFRVRARPTGPAAA